jgi:hypothetical protein
MHIHIRTASLTVHSSVGRLISTQRQEVYVQIVFRTRKGLPVPRSQPAYVRMCNLSRNSCIRICLEQARKGALKYALCTRGAHSNLYFTSKQVGGTAFEYAACLKMHISSRGLISGRMDSNGPRLMDTFPSCCYVERMDKRETYKSGVDGIKQSPHGAHSNLAFGCGKGSFAYIPELAVETVAFDRSIKWLTTVERPPSLYFEATAINENWNMPQQRKLQSGLYTKGSWYIAVTKIKGSE